MEAGFLWMVFIRRAVTLFNTFNMSLQATTISVGTFSLGQSSRRLGQWEWLYFDVSRQRRPSHRSLFIWQDLLPLGVALAQSTTTAKARLLSRASITCHFLALALDSGRYWERGECWAIDVDERPHCNSHNNFILNSHFAPRSCYANANANANACSWVCRWSSSWSLSCRLTRHHRYDVYTQ